MQNFNSKIKILFLFGLLFAIFHASPVHAKGMYPIQALGNCRDKKECFLYCEIPSNSPACWSYGAYVLHKNVLGESTTSQDQLTQKYNITFPVSALGNCANVSECKAYCDIPDNQTACVLYAKEKHFYKEKPADAATASGSAEQQQNLTLQKAKKELGCESMEACRAYCETNKEVCAAFAKKYNLHPKTEDDTKQLDLLGRAKAELGCDSMETCRRYCESNKGQCMAFTKKYGLEKRSQDDQKKPGNCDSDRACNAYCSEHPDECKGFRERTGTDSASLDKPKDYVGPGGCKTEDECKMYCAAHPDECPSYPKPSGHLHPTMTDEQKALLQKIEPTIRAAMQKGQTINHPEIQQYQPQTAPPQGEY